MTEFIAGVSPDIPWHVTAFHKDYKMDDPDDTRPQDLLRAAEIGRQADCDIFTPEICPAW